jgi:hypothetical protein
VTTDVLERVERKLKEYPHVRFERNGPTISIFPTTASGFEASLRARGAAYVVTFDGWHEHFDDPEAALRCLAFGLSSRARLKVTSRGGHPYRWTLEFRDEAGWREDSTTGLIFRRFWGRREERYLQNDLWSSAPPTPRDSDPRP